MAVTSRDDAADEARWVRYGSAPLIATLLLPIIIGVIIVFKCVFNHCCVRKTTTKDEMYGLEGRMTMLPTAESDFVTLPRNSSSGAAAASTSSTEVTGGRSSARSPPIGISKRDSTEGETSEVKLRHHHHFPLTAQVSGSGEKAGSNNNDHKAIESSPGSSVFNGDSRLRGSSGGASRLTSSQDSTELAGSLKRASAQHRQLPDLPQTPGTGNASHPPRRSSSVLSHDGTSELYATVGETPLPEGSSSKRSSHYAQIRENPIANSSGKVGSSSSGSLLPVTNGIPPGPSSGGSAVPRLKGSEATPSSDSETYASTSLNHPYAKLKKNSAEHPYARVRASNNNNDEETDTDNYDLPQFLTRQVVGAPGGGPSTSGHHAPLQNRGSSSGVPAASAAGGGASSGVADDDDDEEGPVPPRRIGRPWRRNSQPNNADNASHFSGDSHDSRGYTSISVREPLSNLRNQTVASTRHYDSHYATVSDDSEEMYAAIDDPNDSNYMRIPGDHDNNNPRRPTWLGGPNVASPIPERREANSPLPPVPLVPPPDLSPGAQGPTTNAPGSPTANALPPLPSALALPPQASALPVYAQVTKKKKGQGNKAVVTQTASNASTSSSQQILVREAPLGSENPLPPPPPAKDSMSSSSSHSHYATSSHHQHHRSKRAASLMDNSNPMDADTVDSRRWSKADISYSEFEVVRENLFPTSSETNALIDDPPLQHHLLRSPGSGRSDVSPTSTSSAVRQQQQQQELVDEDNYNIIPEKNPGRSSRQGGVVVSSAASSSTAPLSSVALGPPTGTRIRLDSGNYHEIEPRNLNNTYQEIGGGKEPSDHYQEIGDRCKDDEYDDDDGGELYQVIDKKGNKNNSEFEDDDEEEDQFYERVKKPGSREGKKHGYEKIKKKEPSTSKPHPPGNLSRVKPALGSDEDEDEEGDDKADQMYESVKYPPYERLKESKDDLLDSEDARNNGSDYYEDIGYSRVKPKGSSSSKAKTPEASTAADTRLTCFVAGADNHQLKPPPDISHLYAQVDKTKKRGSKSSSTVQVTSPDNSVVQDISGNNNEPIMSMPLYSKVNKVSKNKGSGSSTANRNTATVVAAGSAGEQGHLHHSHYQPGNHSSSRSSTNDNSIEYI